MDLKPLSSQEMNEQTGGSLVSIIVGGLIAGIAIPAIINLFTAKEANIGLPGGIKIDWNNKDAITTKQLEKRLDILEKKYHDVLPPFYEV